PARWDNARGLAEHFARATPPVTPTATGLQVDEQGRGTFAVTAPRADSVVLYSRKRGMEHQQRLSHVDRGLRWARVNGMTTGTQDGLRVDGPWAPSAGLFCNPRKLLLDPHARGVSHASPLMSSFFAYEGDSMLDRVGDHHVR